MRPLTLLLGCLLISTPLLAQLPSYVPTDGLQAAYMLNGNGLDSHTEGIHAAEYDITSGTDRFGNAGGACNFNGSSSFLEVEESEIAPFEFTDAFTISLWAKWSANDNTHYVRLLNKYHHALPNHGSFQIINGPPGEEGTWGGTVRTDIDGYVWSLTSLASTENEWTHLTVTFDGQNIRTYENGLLVRIRQASGDVVNDGSSMRIGAARYPPTSDYFFNGNLDDLFFWNQTLSSSEIESLYSASLTPPAQGCTDSGACNYDQDADYDSNSCTYPGCTDSEACNFAAEAGCDDGSCVYPPLVELGSNTTLCDGQSLDLSVDAPGLTTTWSTGATGPAISVTETGTYTVQSGGDFGADYRLEFDGVDDYVSFGSSLDITTYPFSIQADITVPSDYWPILYTDDGTDGYSGIWFEIGPEIVGIAVGEGSGGGPNNRRSKSGSHGLQAGTTTTVSAVVRGANDMSLYVNGVDIGGNHSGTGNTTFVDNGLDAVTGRITPSSGPGLNQLHYHDGTMDNLHVWTKALTNEEVAQFVDTPAEGDEDGLLAVYTFDEGAGNTSTDGANGVEAQLFGSPNWVLEEAGCNASDTITVHVIDCENLCGPGTVWDPILQSCVAEVPEAAAAEDCSMFTLQELSTGYLNQQQQMDALDTLLVTQQAAIDSLNALLNNCQGND